MYVKRGPIRDLQVAIAHITERSLVAAFFEAFPAVFAFHCCPITYAGDGGARRTSGDRLTSRMRNMREVEDNLVKIYVETNWYEVNRIQSLLGPAQP